MAWMKQPYGPRNKSSSNRRNVRASRWIFLPGYVSNFVWLTEGDQHAKAVELHPAAGARRFRCYNCLRRASSECGSTAHDGGGGGSGHAQRTVALRPDPQLLSTGGNVYPESETGQGPGPGARRGQIFPWPRELREGCKPGAPDRKVEQGQEGVRVHRQLLQFRDAVPAGRLPADGLHRHQWV